MKWVVYSLLFVNSVMANTKCKMSSPNDILKLIKENHPRILINTHKESMLKEDLEIANQIPNFELDAETTLGEKFNGDVLKTSISLKYPLEIGGKRRARFNMAKTSLDVSRYKAKSEREDIIIETILNLYQLRQIYEFSIGI